MPCKKSDGFIPCNITATAAAPNSASIIVITLLLLLAAAATAASIEQCNSWPFVVAPELRPCLARCKRFVCITDAHVVDLVETHGAGSEASEADQALAV